MSLRSRIALLVLAAVALFQGVDRVLRQASFGGAFFSLEQARAAREAEAVGRRFDNELAVLERQAIALRERFADQVTLQAALETIPGWTQIDVALVLNAAGRVLGSQVLDPVSRKPLELRAVPNEAFAPSHPLLMSWTLHPDGPRGVLATERGILLISTVAHGEGDARRLFCAGQFVDETLMEQMRLDLGAPFDLIAMPPVGLPRDEVSAIERASTHGVPEVIERDSERLTVYQSFADLRGFAAYVVRLDVSRTEGVLWAKLEEYELMSAIAVALLLPLVLLIALQVVVTGPLRRLTAWAVNVGKSGDTSLRIRIDRGDEIGRLAAEFDRMLGEVARARAAESSTARLAGRSEIAVSVMHNVGTIVNSVNVSATLCKDQVQHLATEEIAVILGELQQHRGGLDEYLDNHDRGRHLLPFFEALVGKMSTVAKTLGEEADCVATGIAKIAALMNAMRSVEDHGPSTESVGLHEQVDLALELCASTEERFATVRVQKRIEPTPTVVLDRFRLSEILVNLMRNAFQAMEQLAEADRRLIIRVSSLDHARVRISVTDVGIGISPETMSRIFVQGFTTRAGGNGFGLHFASIAAMEMGGELIAKSDGPGLGATFHLDLPLDANKARSEQTANRAA